MNNEKALEEAIEKTQKWLNDLTVDFPYDHVEVLNEAARAHLSALQSPLPEPAEHKEPDHPYKAGEDLEWLCEKIYAAEAQGVFLAHPTYTNAALFNIRKAFGIKDGRYTAAIANRKGVR